MDALQLCGQAMCLEEMLCCEIPEGALYYGEPRRRTEVVFTPELRQEVRELTCPDARPLQPGPYAEGKAHQELQRLLLEGALPAEADAEQVRGGLSAPGNGGGAMKQLLNTLFVTSEDVYLSLDGENVVANRDGEAVARYPAPHFAKHCDLFLFRRVARSDGGLCPAGDRAGVLYPQRAVSGPGLRSGAGKCPAPQDAVPDGGQPGPKLPYRPEHDLRQGL